MHFLVIWARDLSVFQHHVGMPRMSEYLGGYIRVVES